MGFKLEFVVGAEVGTRERYISGDEGGPAVPAGRQEGRLGDITFSKTFA